jgi:hypothetical protein
MEQADHTPSPKDLYGPEGEVIAKCEEFTLYANGWLESSPEIERALCRATLGISDRKGSEDRLELDVSLLDLAEHAAKPLRIEDAKSRGVAPDRLDAGAGEAARKRNADLLERLSGTLGRMLIPMLSDSQPGSARKKAEKAASGIRNAITSIQSAARAIARWKTKRPKPKSNHPGAVVWEMQLVAKEIFRETRKRPTKRQIRHQLEDEGWGIKSKDAAARWAERFKDGGLENLEDWAPP